MKTKLPCFGAAVVAAVTLFIAPPRALAQAVYNYAMSFRGAGDYVRIPDANALGLTNNYTLECWFKADAFGGLRGLISKYHSPSANGYLLRLTANHLDFDEMTNASVNLQAGVWYHAAAVNSNSVRRLYLNGQPIPLTNTALAVQANTNPVCLGADYLTENNRFFKGQMDEVRIWSKARSQAEIQATMNGSLTGTEPNLAGYYRFDEQAGIAVYDGTPNHLNGRMVNRPFRSRSYWWPFIALNSPNPYTNECHTTYVETATVNETVVAIGAGWYHSLALRADGTVVGLGYNYSGQTSTPASATNVVTAVSGWFHNVALKTDGTVVAWGDASYSQTTVPGTAVNVVAIAAGGYHSLALRMDGSVIGWGMNDDGQITIPASAANVVAVSAGGYHSLALRADGTVIGWGRNSTGQASIPASATNVVSISAGYAHSLALRADGTIIGWGDNEWGQATIPANTVNVVAISAGFRHSLALRADGTVLAWGDNLFGGTSVPAGATNVRALAASMYHSLALKADGTILGWGSDVYGATVTPAGFYLAGLPLVVTGALNTNVPGLYPLAYAVTNSVNAVDTENRLVVVADTLPPAITLAGANPTMVGLGASFVDPGAAAATDLCAGLVTSRVVSNATVNTSVAGIYTNTFTVTDDYLHTTTVQRTVVVGAPLATTLPASNLINDQATLNGTANPKGSPTGAWFEWGALPGRDFANSSAVQSVGNGTNAVAFSASLSGLTPGITYDYRAVAANSPWVVRGSEQLFWTPALNLHGPAFQTVQLGRPWPDPTSINTSVLAVDAGSGYGLAVVAGGTVRGWGAPYYDYGQTNAPASATNVVAVAAGMYHCLALRCDGTVVAWGDNSRHQTNIPPSVTNVIAIAAGDSHCLALRADGTVLAWGDGSQGQTNIPPSATNVVAISAGGGRNLALRADDTVIVWGSTGDAANCYGDFTNMVAIACGTLHWCALRADGTVFVCAGIYTDIANVPADATNLVALAAGFDHCLGLRADGTVVAWGRYGNGPGSVPASVTNVVAVSAGEGFSLALRADGVIIAWGYNSRGESSVPSFVYDLGIRIGVSGAVNTNVLGTYVLTYGVTNALGAIATATRTVVVATLPIVTTEPVTSVNPTAATLNGTVNPRASETLGWFEYGLGAEYGGATPALPLGNSTNAQAFASSVTGLLPWMTYHYRAVATNGLGRVAGPDATFTLPRPSFVVPTLSALPDVTLPQGGSTSVWFTVSSAGLDLQVNANNSVLLPGGALALGGSGTLRSLSVSPAAIHSGSARVTVTATDGSQSASSAFNLTVTPKSGGISSWLQLTDAQRVPPQTFRFQIADAGTGSTNYTVEYRSGLFATNLWIQASNAVVSPLGGGLFQVDTLPPPGSAGFYRVKGFRLLMANFDSADLTAQEGSLGAPGPVVVFNGIYTGTVTCIWGDDQGTTWTNQVQVNGTTAVIPVPGSYLSDNATLGQLRHLTLQLGGGMGLVLGAGTESTVTIEENDSVWKGGVETSSGTLDFGLTMTMTNGNLRGQIQNDGFGFFPTNVLVQLNLTADTFTAVATNIPLPTLVSYPSLGFTNYLDLRLDASNSPGVTNVSPSLIQGVATLVSRVPNGRHLDAGVSGPFMLLKTPTAPSTNNVPLQPAL